MCKSCRSLLKCRCDCQMVNTFKDRKTGETKCLHCRHALKI